jgi:hypothetical protein
MNNNNCEANRISYLRYIRDLARVQNLLLDESNRSNQLMRLYRISQDQE